MAKGSTKFSVKKKLFLINCILLTAALLASGFAISQFINLGQQLHDGAITQIQIEQTIQSVIIIQISLASIAVGVNGYSFLFARKLTNPIIEAANAVKKISEGDLTVMISQSKSKDELGELTNALHSMSENLRNLVTDVRETAIKVASDSRESAAATEELNSSVEEVAATVQQIASGSQTQALELASAKAIVENVRNTNSADGSSAADKMSRIIELTNQSSEKVKSLADKSAKITSVVETIRDIAEKTNLLALNAAIEAARAGESGRGFAVVADEVRRLAEGSAKSSEEIDNLIREIQEEIQHTVKGIDSSAQEIEEGREVVDMSLKALVEIGNKVAEVAAVAEENASATDQASAAVDQQTTATAEISHSSQSTATLAEELENKVSKFKLSDNSEESPSDLPIKELEKSQNLAPQEQIIETKNGLMTKLFSKKKDKTNTKSEFDQLASDTLGDDEN
ncbi:MAG: methyl-accepting chemotaxis protein [Crenarchaeota archaeon]|nr:MAG: methyl-accepting chemotaxis protein [Thermoproteota archaeon]RDJ34552.1 MAG: methyl-accepting chemotaxis protein [Thermoproteota archaeon]RDJ35928.1 MAG: methyl-accepting chemotaxis protein [Thermoproteota archaeon]RDJ38505.1 MAG: methyl-accepting chemotaxis protein [Thermoproteota archaeon]